MSEAQVDSSKPKAEVETVRMSDGRTVGFSGKRKMVKEVMLNEEEGGVKIRFDFRNGETRTFEVPASLGLQFIGHGASQKIGDETAGLDDLDDMVIAVDTICERLAKGEWGVTRAAGDGFAGASVVVRAIVEATGKSVADVKAFLQGKLDKAKNAGQKLTRAELYASFRAPGTKTGAIIERLESAKKAKQPAVDADALLGEI